jgi:hypothetical protein
MVNEHLSELAAVAVAPGVVRHEALDSDDAVGGEVLERADEERGASVSAFVVEDLAVREPAVVVND